MLETGHRNSACGADTFGLKHLTAVHWNLLEPALYEHALAHKEGNLSSGGALMAVTGAHTGRSPKDKFVVRDANTEGEVWWDNNGAITPEQFETLYQDFLKEAEDKTLFAQDLYGGADPASRIKVRVYTEFAWHSLFIRTMLRRPERAELDGFVPEMTIIDLPSFKADPARHGVRSETVIAVDFSRGIVLIGNSSYAGEMKKSVFTALNYILPKKGIMPMHCSANVGEQGDVCLFFGLSGTGKTTLSADPDRALIGDDEHGWSERGVFNFEGGNYAKVVKLSAEGEPLIWQASRRFGVILENVVIDDRTLVPDFDDVSITENTRSCYPINFIPGAVLEGMGGHPKNVMMLTADAFGVLPPIARLTPEQAMYHFLSGYTAKVAGTERGVTEPKATFSACFGAPFLPLPPSVYANLLGEKLKEHGAHVWLVNTGWTGGAFGTGSRMKLSYTRTMVTAALRGELDNVKTRQDSIFGLHVPVSIPGVPDNVLDPRSTWADGAEYDAMAAKLAGMFRDNFRKYEAGVQDGVKQAGPK